MAAAARRRSVTRQVRLSLPGRRRRSSHVSHPPPVTLAPPASSGISLDFAEASAEALPFDDASFDAVTIAFGLRNVGGAPSNRRICAHPPPWQVTNTSKALGECLRVLKKGGRFMCVGAPPKLPVAPPMLPLQVP